MESRLEFETLISDLSSRFINLPSGEVDRAIEDALRRVCELLGVDLAVLWQWSATAPDVITPTHAYPSQEGLLPARAAARQEHFPWLRQEMLAGRVVAVSSLEEFPAEAAVDREYLPPARRQVASQPAALRGGRAARRPHRLQHHCGRSATGRTRW